MSFDDGGQPTGPADPNADFDQQVANRFTLLDRVEPPQTWPPRPVAPPEPVVPLRSWGIGLAAAAVVVVIGAAAFLAGNDDGAVVVDSADRENEVAAELDTPDADDSPDQRSDDLSDDDRPSVVVDDDGDGEDEDEADEDDGDGDGDGDDTEDRDDDDRSDDSDDDTEDRDDDDRSDDDNDGDDDDDDGDDDDGDDDDEGEADGSENEDDDGRDDDEASATTATTVEDERPIDTKPIETRPTTTTVDDDEEPSSTRPGDGWPETGEMVTISGLVTEVFTDCRSRLVLGENGKVEQVGPVSCDGGSHIIVDGTRIQTSAGFVAADQYYDKHPADLQPGTKVRVRAVPTSFGGSGRFYSLACERCGVSKGG